MVYRARWNKTFDVAVKKRLATTDRSLFIEEARVMHKLHHRRIVCLLGVCTEPPEEPVFIITELLEKGALRNFLSSDEGRELVLSDLIDMIAQVRILQIGSRVKCAKTANLTLNCSPDNDLHSRTEFNLPS